MEYKIVNYQANTIIKFEQYKDMSTKNVYDINPAYIDWCIINLNHFYVSNNSRVLTDFSFSDKIQKYLLVKEKLYDKQIAEENHLTCRDGYGKHDLDDEQCIHCYGRVCIICGCIDDCSYRDEKDYNPGSIYDEYGDEIEW